uniref:Uncharacterized protein n=1 Tax=Arundo donax TaxID=35708 RepID=A0A0A9AJP0_ARUDO
MVSYFEWYTQANMVIGITYKHLPIS